MVNSWLIYDNSYSKIKVTILQNNKKTLGKITPSKRPTLYP